MWQVGHALCVLGLILLHLPDGQGQALSLQPAKMLGLETRAGEPRPYAFAEEHGSKPREVKGEVVGAAISRPRFNAILWAIDERDVSRFVPIENVQTAGLLYRPRRLCCGYKIVELTKRRTRIDKRRGKGDSPGNIRSFSREIEARRRVEQHHVALGTLFAA